MLVKVQRICAVVFALSLVTACSTLNSKPDPETQKKISTAKINTQLGLAYMERHEMQHAKQKFLLALEEAPKSPEPWYSMGYFMEATGNETEAKTYYDKAVSIAPKQGDVQNNYGTYLCRNGDYKGAINHFMLAVKDDNYLDTASAYENAGLCALKIPDKALALNYFNQAIMQDPNHSLSLIESAALEYEFKNFKDAKFRLEEFLAISAPTPQSDLLRHDLASINTHSPYDKLMNTEKVNDNSRITDA